jgi:hypothetical protein
MTAVFAFRPNWRRSVIERLEWLTDVIESQNATEERSRLRTHPRRTLEYEILTADGAARALDALLWRHQAKQVVLPIWTDAQVLTITLAADSITIPAQTAGFDFINGGRAVLLRDHETFEEVTIATVEANQITLSAPTTSAWPAGTRLYPARLARLPEDLPLKRETAGLATGVLRFELDNTDAASQPDTDLYQGIEVSTRRPNWIGGINYSYRRKIERHDYLLGVVEVDDISGLPAPIRTHRFLLEERAAIGAFRGWLHARAGRAQAFWQPQWQLDLEQSAPIGETQLELRVRALDYAAAYAFDPNRRDIAILHRASGNWYFRRIEAVAPGGPDEEILTLDASLGIAAAPGELFLAWLVLSRLDADAVEIGWQSAGNAVSDLTLRGVRQ